MEPENLKEYYERRFREIKLGLDRTPGLREHFFFVYELPDGTRRGELLISSGAFRDALTRAMERIDCGETLEYMCRRLGREHGIDCYCSLNKRSNVLKNVGLKLFSNLFGILFKPRGNFLKRHRIIFH